MRVVVAPDSYKGSVSAVQVAAAMERGILAVFPDARVDKAPIADGGEGTVEALVAATGGQVRTTTVTGPLGAPVPAQWGVLGDGRTAVVEMAAASGLPLVPAPARDPGRATTLGTGELIRAVLDAGFSRLILGIGGSATNDGGTGAARALGARFLDETGRELPPGGAALQRLSRIDLQGLDPRLETLELLVACDVDNPLCGPRGASAVFGPQKGAGPEAVHLLDAALERYGAIAAQTTGRRVADQPGAGAAGGLGAGLLFFTPALLRPGVDIVLEAIGFSELAARADVVLTGEGHTDFQTACGKAPVGVARLAKQHGVPVLCLAGGLGAGYEEALARGIDAALGCPAGPASLEECMAQGSELIARATERMFRVLRAGMRLPRS